jgi:hypothetical protein
LPEDFVGRCKVMLSRIMDTLTSFSQNMSLKRSIPLQVDFGNDQTALIADWQIMEKA